jgi:hypothetical protein
MTTIEEHQKRVQALIKKIWTVAFIIAGIMVVVVIYTSISKLKTTEEQITVPSTVKQKSEQLEEQKKEQPKKQPEEITPSVKITSATVIPENAAGVPVERQTGASTRGGYCIVKISGTATMPVERGILEFYRSNKCTADGKYVGHDVEGCLGKDLLTYFPDCGNWSLSKEASGACTRYSGQPATTEWSVSNSESLVGQIFFHGEGVTYVAEIKSGDEVLARDSVTLTCF